MLPNFIAVTPVKPVPVMVTLVPPPRGPTAGEMAVTVGFPKVNWSAAEVGDVPFAVVTVMSTVPAGPAGLVAVIEVALFIVYEAAAVALKVTAVAPVKPVPVMVTLVPPPVAPAAGETAVTVGRVT